jgi:hypothetical protein
MTETIGMSDTIGRKSIKWLSRDFARGWRNRLGPCSRKLMAIEVENLILAVLERERAEKRAEAPAK